MTELCPFKVWAKIVFEIWSSNLFCPIFTLILGASQFGSQLDPNWPFYPLKIHKNDHISKCHFGQASITKSLLLLQFSMNLSETFRTDVDMDFANNVGSGYLIEPKIQKKIPCFFSGSNFFWRPKLKIRF